MLDSKNLAQDLLAWNRKHLISEGELTLEMVAEYFHSELVVCANGRRYETDLEGYLLFLNRFRQSIAAIHYNVTHEISQATRTVLCMCATVDRIDGSQDQFEAMLLLEFNDQQKITLWHEVYIEIV